MDWKQIRFQEAKAVASACLIENCCPLDFLNDASDDWSYDFLSNRLHVAITGDDKLNIWEEY